MVKCNWLTPVPFKGLHN